MNYIKYYTRGALMGIVLAFTSGGILQTFFAYMGFSESQIGLHTTVINVAQIAVMVLNIFLADGIRNVKVTMAVFGMGPAVFAIGMLPFCAMGAVDTDKMYMIALILCFVSNLFWGFYSILIYRFMYMIADKSEFARMENVNGLICGAITMGVGAIITWLSTRYDFRAVMTVGFWISIVFCIVSSVLVASMKVRRAYEEPVNKTKFDIKKLVKPEFAWFYIPNFLRGGTWGVMGVIAIVCMKEITRSTTVISGLVTVLNVAGIVGCVLYNAIRKKVNTPLLYLLCGIDMFLFLPLMLLGRSWVVFCVFYFVAGVGYNIANTAAAILATEIVDYEEIGMYTCVRLITVIAGQAVVDAGVSLLIDYVPSILILVACGAFQLASGIMYYVLIKKLNKLKKRRESHESENV